MLKQTCGHLLYNVLFSRVNRESSVEYASARTHFLPAIGFALFAVTRPWVLGDGTASSFFLTAAASVMALVFFVSVAFHTWRVVPNCGGYWRSIDISAIYLGLCTTSLADVALATADFEVVRWQTVADPIAAALALAIFFAVRRSMLEWGETGLMIAEKLPIARYTHQDLEHEGVRGVGAALLSLTWVAIVPLFYHTLESWVASLFVGLYALATVVLWVGSLADSLEAVVMHCFCYVPCLGWFDSHAMWHVMSLEATLLTAVAREVVLANR